MKLTSKEGFDKLPQILHNFFIKHPPRPFKEYATEESSLNDPNLNPFLRAQNPITGKWYKPKYSSRRSAVLYKLAKKFGIQDLLPVRAKKLHEERYYNIQLLEGVRNPRLHKWEHDLPKKLEERKKALENMDNIIIEKRPDYKKIIQNRKQRTWF